MENQKNVEQKIMDKSENELEKTVRSEHKKTAAISGTKLLVGAVLGLATGGIAYAATQSLIIAGAVAGLVGAYAPSAYEEQPAYRTAEQYN